MNRVEDINIPIVCTFLLTSIPNSRAHHRVLPLVYILTMETGIHPGSHLFVCTINRSTFLIIKYPTPYTLTLLLYIFPMIIIYLYLLRYMEWTFEGGSRQLYSWLSVWQDLLRYWQQWAIDLPSWYILFTFSLLFVLQESTSSLLNQLNSPSFPVQSIP